MANELGRLVGKVRHSMSITNSRDEKVSITVSFDFSTATDQDIKSLLVGNRTIAFQRPSRSLSADELTKLDGAVILATECGKKVKSREERIAELTAIGLPIALAEMAIDNPAAFESAMASAKGE